MTLACQGPRFALELTNPDPRVAISKGLYSTTDQTAELATTAAETQPSFHFTLLHLSPDFPGSFHGRELGKHHSPEEGKKKS